MFFIDPLWFIIAIPGLMVSAGIVTAREQAHAGKVLNAAFLTYVAALVTALLQLLYFILRARR